MMRSSTDGGVLPLPASVRIGVDLLPCADVRRSLDEFGERYLRRAYTSGELGDCVDAHGAPDVGRLAGRFAVKEAAIKALGAPDGASLTDIATVAEPSGRPRLALCGVVAATAAALGVRSAAVSISHDGPYAVAMVVLELDPRG